jgi:ATP-dependent DNA helicase PIF1
MLNQLRWGKCPSDVLQALKETKNNLFEGDIKPTVLYSKNVDVDALNLKKFKELIENGARSFTYHSSFSCEGGQIWAQSSKIPDIVELCVGAQVVLTWNVDLERGLCNGARGIVTDIGLSGVTVKFMSGLTTVIGNNRVENEDNKNIWMSFMPLRLAYALTINKSQGMTLDCAIVVLDVYSNKEFMYGRAYTALSRVRNLKSIQIMNVCKDCFAVHPEVVEFYEQGNFL